MKWVMTVGRGRFALLSPAQTQEVRSWDTRFRRAVLYPLSYEGLPRTGYPTVGASCVPSPDSRWLLSGDWDDLSPNVAPAS